MKTLALALAFIKAVPILEDWYQRLLLLYIEQKVKQNDKNFLASMDSARNIGDVTGLQRDIGKLL